MTDAIFDKNSFLKPIDFREMYVTIGRVHYTEPMKQWYDTGRLSSVGDDAIILLTIKGFLKIYYHDILSITPVPKTGEFAKKFKEAWGL